MAKTKKTSIIAWCFYDFANSAFFSVVTTFVFSAYFATKIAPDKIVGTYWWGNAIAISALVVAFISPALGAMADFSGHNKRWLFVLTYIGISASLGLWFAYPVPEYTLLTLSFVVVGSIALEIGMMFYNAMLPNMIAPSYIGRVSGWGWGMGYIGGIICMALTLVILVKGNLLSLNTQNYANIRACGPFIALWLLIFSTPLFLFVKPAKSQNLSIRQAIPKGLKSLWQTLKNISGNKNLLFFFLARIFYVDGLNTLFALGGVYAAGTFHMGMDDIILLGIMLNISAGLGAMLFAWFDDWFGGKWVIQVSLSALIIFVFLILVVHSKVLFWYMAAGLGFFVGPIQPASRSLLIRLSDIRTITEKFGLFAFSGKATAFLGPWLVASLTMWSQSQRVGLSVIEVFYLVGLIFLCFVKKP